MKKIILLSVFALFAILAESQNQSVVSATKMNVLYKGIYNPIAVAVPGIPAKDVKVSAINAKIEKIDDTNYNVMPGAESTAKITVSGTYKDGKEINYGTTVFRVMPIPSPSVYFARKLNGKDLTKEDIKRFPEVDVKLDDFLFEMQPYKVTGFTYSYIAGEFLRSYNITGNRLTEDAISSIMSQPKETKIFIENIKAIGPDGIVRLMQPLGIVLQ
jgi:hypothetical protein